MRQQMAYDLADILGCKVKREGFGITVDAFRQLNVNGHPVDMHVQLLAHRIGQYSLMALAGFRFTWNAKWTDVPAQPRLGMLVIIEEKSYLAVLLDLADLPQAPGMFFDEIEPDGTVEAATKIKPFTKQAFTASKNTGPWSAIA